MATKAKKTEKVNVKLPLAPKGQANYETCSVNGKVYKIMRGVNVEVPIEVAEVLANSQLAEREAFRYIESKTE